MLYKECYMELRKAILALSKKKAFEKFDSMNFFYMLDEKSKVIAVFNSTLAGMAPSLTFYIGNEGINYLLDSYLSTTGLIHNGVFANMIVLTLSTKQELTLEDTTFLKSHKIKIFTENNLIGCEFKEGYFYQYLSISKMKKVLEYVYYLLSLLNNEKEDIDECFQEEKMVLAGFDTKNHLYEIQYGQEFILEKMPTYKKADLNFIKEYEESIYTDDTCYIGRYYEPFKDESCPYYDTLFVAYYENKKVQMIQNISCKPNQFLEYSKGFLDMVFKKEGLPTRIVFNDRRMVSSLFKTLNQLNIDVDFQREPELLDTVFLDYVSAKLESQEEGEKKTNVFVS